MKALGYVRVSTEGQATRGISLDAQQAKIEAYAVAQNPEFEGLIEDAGKSGNAKGCSKEKTG